MPKFALSCDLLSGSHQMSNWRFSIKRFLKESALYFMASPHSKIRQLNALRHLDDRLLMDIGVTRSEISTKEIL